MLFDCLSVRLVHMGPFNSLLHALFSITLLKPTDSCGKPCFWACCKTVRNRVEPCGHHQHVWCAATIALCSKMKQAYNKEKEPQLTLTHSTHPSVQHEAVWPKFTLPHLPRHLFSLLGKHLEKCMRERGKKEYICLNTSHLVRGKAKTRTSADIYSPLVANCKGPGWLTERAWSDLCRISLNHLWRLCPNTEKNSCTFSVLTSDPHLCNRPNKCYLIPN